MRSKKSYYWIVVGLLALGLSSCRERSRSEPLKPEPPPAVEQPARPKASPPVRRRLPPPLRPSASRHGAEEDIEQLPCTELAAKVCGLLAEGAEECGETRARVRHRPGTLRQSQCAEALEWYAKRVERARRVRGCKLLADVKCRAWGSAAMACVNARADADHVSGDMARACLAELLRFKGLDPG